MRVHTKEYYDVLAYHGARLMDKALPHWIYDTDPTLLTMQSASSCILGQNFGWYDDGRRKLGLTSAEAEMHGFVINGTANTTEDARDLNRAYSMLTESWIAEIKQRLEKKRY